MKLIRIEERNIEHTEKLLELDPERFPSGITSEQGRINYILSCGLESLEQTDAPQTELTKANNDQ